MPVTPFRQNRLIATAPARGLFEITGEVAGWLHEVEAAAGMLTLFLRHTSASLLIQENCDPDVQRDLEAFLDRLAPEDAALYSHVAEGPDDMPAHIKGALTQVHLSIPVFDRAMLLGRYQGIYLFEHRRTPRPREIVAHFEGRFTPDDLSE
jgi:secondary thiamine-phosphate synthase enzyme